MAYVFTPNGPTAIPVQGTGLQYPVRRIFCVGRNYADHVRELGGDPKMDPPIFFTKPADAIVTNGALITYPQATTDLHHEVELVVALGKPLQNANEAEAKAAVFGLAVGVDLTRRDLQAQAKKSGAPWDTAKAFDHSAPISNISAISELPDPLTGSISLLVNELERQSANLSEMIWSVPELLAKLSGYFRLHPGDLVFTGTPEGVGALQRGDRVHCAIAGVGELDFAIASE